VIVRARPQTSASAQQQQGENPSKTFELPAESAAFASKRSRLDKPCFSGVRYGKRRVGFSGIRKLVHGKTLYTNYRNTDVLWGSRQVFSGNTFMFRLTFDRAG